MHISGYPGLVSYYADLIYNKVYSILIKRYTLYIYLLVASAALVAQHAATVLLMLWQPVYERITNIVISSQ